MAEPSNTILLLTIPAGSVLTEQDLRDAVARIGDTDTVFSISVADAPGVSR